MFIVMRTHRFYKLLQEWHMGISRQSPRHVNEIYMSLLRS